MKNQKRVFKEFQYRECDAFAEYLRKQSLQGWHFKEWRMGLVFEKGEPKDIAYAVEVFPKGSEMDTHPEEDAEEYADYCEAAGWKLLDGKRRFCIFRQETEDAVRIVTPEERMQNVWKAEGRAILNRGLAPLILTVGDWFQVFNTSSSYWLLSNLMVFMLFGITMITALWVLEGIGLFLWRLRAAQRLKNGKEVCYRKKVPAGKILSVAFLAGFIVVAYTEHETQNMVIFVITFAICMLLTLGIEWGRPSRGDNWIIQLCGGIGFVFLMIVVVAVVVFSTEEPENTTVSVTEVPLNQSFLGRKDVEVSSAEGERMGSILAKGWRYSVEYETKESETGSGSGTESFYYELYESKYDWVLNALWKSNSRRTYSQQMRDCTEEWGAEEAMCETDRMGSYMVKYPEKMIVIYTVPSLEKEEIQNIRKTLMEFREG